jgi:hypothetical protein
MTTKLTIDNVEQVLNELASDPDKAYEYALQMESPEYVEIHSSGLRVYTIGRFKIALIDNSETWATEDDWMKVTITNIILSNNVKHLQNNCFSRMTKLETIIIPDSVSGIIGLCAFLGCINLRSVVIPKSVNVIDGYAFSECSSLTSITIPDSVINICSYAFCSCENLKSVDISNSIVRIEPLTFHGCSSLKFVVIPNSVTYIGASAFGYCSSLESIVIPELVNIIRDGAFQGCSSLKSVVMPESAIEINEDAFNGCIFIH